MTVKSLTPNLMVDDIEATVEWYREMFDSEVVATLPADADDYFWAQVTIGESLLMLQERDSLEAKIPAMADRETGGSTALYVDVDDVEAMRDRLETAGTEVVEPPEETEYGWRLFAATDPNGYVLWFGERLDEDAEEMGIQHRKHNIAADRIDRSSSDVRPPVQESEHWG
ncbi:MAG: VOC family protein [Haloquadratum sp.]